MLLLFRPPESANARGRGDKSSRQAALQRYGNTEIELTLGRSSAATTLVPGIFDKHPVLLLVADVEALRNHVAQMFGMYSRAAFGIELWGPDIHYI